ncbi:MAG: hypothetical protein KIT10_02640 [Flavobacteriales bacterium]|nr:hypothetical protein [Flavobacteriales bacterium]
MKNYLIIALALCSAPCLAVDRIVEEFGVPPAFPSIASAITAANDGDRIIIKNRAGGVPWIETINVAKSLEFLSFDNNGFFNVQGNWTLTAATGRVIRIIGMYNTSGSITSSGTGTVGSASVSILDSRLVNGNMTLTTAVFKNEVVGCTLESGRIHLNMGSVIGCNINNQGVGHAIYINSAAAFQNDTSAVVGNIVVSTDSSPAIFMLTPAQVVHVRNNYIRHSNEGIRLNSGNTQAVPNLIRNNTIVALAGSVNNGINLGSLSSNSVWEVMNNAIRANTGNTKRGVHNGGSLGNAQVNVYWNVFDASLTVPVATGFTFVGNNVEGGNVNVDLATGALEAGSSGIDQANPAAPFFDLDLSLGDAGAYGGSYTLVNFHPLHTGAARVFLAGHPYNIREGATLRVKAKAWDR